MSSISGVGSSGISSSSSNGIQVRQASGFGVNGRITVGQDSFTFSQLRDRGGDSTSLLRLNYALGTLATAQDKLG
ncbi:MAG: hypothetical protein KDD70_19170, partial [Bdellovibrionales bacterium]|nr:hypothetical protein [Bdellovibrionales bacterium]